jgi:hypothetical protein
MHSIKEDNGQTNLIKNSKKHKQYAFPILVIFISAILICAVCSLAIPGFSGKHYQTVYGREQQAQITKRMLKEI